MCFIQVRFGIYPGEHAAILPLGLWERVQSLTRLGVRALVASRVAQWPN
jgi:hypothetical protein